MRTLGRLFIGVILLGLMLGFTLRERWPRRHLRWLFVACFMPAVAHAVFAVFAAVDASVEPAWVISYLGVVSISVVAAWWYLLRLVPTHPFSAALVVPGQALLQGLATGGLERVVIARGAAVDPVATAVFGGVALLLGAALLVVLPTREHFPNLPRAPAWWVALMRTLGKR